MLEKSEQLEIFKEKLCEILNRELLVFCEKMFSSRMGDVFKEWEINERYEVVEGYERNEGYEDDIEIDGKEFIVNYKLDDDIMVKEIDNLKRKLIDDLIGVFCLNEGEI